MLRWKQCPMCREYAVRWRQVAVVFPDEPPLFGNWVCLSCGARTEVEPTPLLVKVARDSPQRDDDGSLANEIAAYPLPHENQGDDSRCGGTRRRS